MPMLTTVLMRSPVAPCQWPSRTSVTKARICSHTLRTSGITSLPSTIIGSRPTFRSATW